MDPHRAPRWGWVAALSVALVLVGGCGTSAVTGGRAPAPPGRPATLGPVPWAQLPVTDADVRPPGSFPGAAYAGPLIPVSCGSGQLHGAVVLSRDAAGTQGAVSLWASSGVPPASCSLPAESLSGAVLDAAGHVLDVTVAPTGAHPVNPPVGPFPYVVGRTSPTGPNSPPVMLVRWEGQYCGPAPVTLRIGFEGASVDLVVSGSPPPCAQHDQPNGPLVLGFVSDPGELGQPVPLDRGALSASLGLPRAMAPDASSFDFTVTLTDTASHPVSLAPCPGYAIGVSGKAYAGAPNPSGTIVAGQLTETGLLNCPAAPARLLAHQSIVFDMRFLFADAQPSTQGVTPVPHQNATVLWMIAGVAAATGTLGVS
ncbi:MAG TPA: hypothetical protein VMF60_06805 [Acidimicrobiales bacterium]|nr:hypothetical protein [Acidimicrobiales bacterium]